MEAKDVAWPFFVCVLGAQSLEGVYKRNCIPS